MKAWFQNLSQREQIYVLLMGAAIMVVELGGLRGGEEVPEPTAEASPPPVEDPTDDATTADPAI